MTQFGAQNTYVYSKILLKLNVTKSFFAMGLDFDYSHSWTAIVGQFVAIVNGKKTTQEFHHLRYEIWAHIFNPSLVNQTSCHHIT
jgi:hypothetical protein